MELQVFVGDRVLPISQAGVSVFDAGFQSGDAVWEGLRVYRGQVYALDDHLTRLAHSAKALRITLPLDRRRIGEAIAATLAANQFSDGVHIRLMVTRGTRTTSGMDPRNAPGTRHPGDHRGIQARRRTAYAAAAPHRQHPPSPPALRRSEHPPQQPVELDPGPPRGARRSRRRRGPDARRRRIRGRGRHGEHLLRHRWGRADPAAHRLPARTDPGRGAAPEPRAGPSHRRGPAHPVRPVHRG